MALPDPLNQLPISDEDIEYLSANFGGCQPREEGKYGIVIPDYKLPAKYIPEQSDLMIIIPADYPVGQLDMFYFSPGVSRKDGKEIDTLAVELHFGKDWQRWSRHYEWDPNIHSVISHIEWIKQILEREVEEN